MKRENTFLRGTGLSCEGVGGGGGQDGASREVGGDDRVFKA